MIDTQALRNDLLNYYGSAMTVFPQASMEYFEVQTASNEKLIEIAQNNNFNLNNYVIKEKRR